MNKITDKTTHSFLSQGLGYDVSRQCFIRVHNIFLVVMCERAEINLMILHKILYQDATTKESSLYVYCKILFRISLVQRLHCLKMTN